jgi:hypothetical protein
MKIVVMYGCCFSRVVSDTSFIGLLLSMFRVFFFLSGSHNEICSGRFKSSGM